MQGPLGLMAEPARRNTSLLLGPLSFSALCTPFPHQWLFALANVCRSLTAFFHSDWRSAPANGVTFPPWGVPLAMMCVCVCVHMYSMPVAFLLRLAATSPVRKQTGMLPRGSLLPPLYMGARRESAPLDGCLNVAAVISASRF